MPLREAFEQLKKHRSGFLVALLVAEATSQPGAGLGRRAGRPLQPSCSPHPILTRNHKVISSTRHQ